MITPCIVVIKIAKMSLKYVLINFDNLYKIDLKIDLTTNGPIMWSNF